MVSDRLFLCNHPSPFVLAHYLLLVKVAVPTSRLGRARSGTGEVMRSSQTQKPLVGQRTCAGLVAATGDRSRQVYGRRNHARTRRRRGRQRR